MRRQLGLARRLVPLLVRAQMRRDAAAMMSNVQGGGEALAASAERVREEASALAAAALDDLDAQVDALVGDVLAAPLGRGVRRLGAQRLRVR